MRKRTSKQIFAETLLEISKRKSIDKITVQQIVDERLLFQFLQQLYAKYRRRNTVVRRQI